MEVDTAGARENIRSQAVVWRQISFVAVCFLIWFLKNGIPETYLPLPFNPGAATGWLSAENEFDSSVNVVDGYLVLEVMDACNSCVATSIIREIVLRLTKK